MQAHDGRKHAKLQPADIEFIVPPAALVTADVMAPPGVARICRGCGKIRLKLEHMPVDKGVTGETQRITVAADTRVTRQNQRQFSAAGVV